MKKDQMKLIFEASSSNEAFARISVAAFMTRLNPTVEEVADVKTAVSEAVTNCIIHAYEGYETERTVEICCTVQDGEIEVQIQDFGVGIADVSLAMEPLYTSKPQLERSGMGFAFMEAFMDALEVESKPKEGTCVRMKKKIRASRTKGD